MKQERRELVIALIWSCAIVLLASLPYLVGMLLTPSDGVFAGFTHNLDDACVYSSWIRQVADGHLLFRNLYTAEPQHVYQFNVLFLVLGLFARLTHLSPAFVQHLSRVILGVALPMLVWKFSRRFLNDPLERSLVVPIVGLSAGIGWLLPRAGTVDLWQPEAITFLSIYQNQLFLAGLILMLAAFHFLYRMKMTGSWRDCSLAGLMLLLLANVHTYDVLTVGAVWTVYLIVKAVRVRAIPWRVVGQSAAAAAMSLPAILYQFYLYQSESVFRLRVASPAPSSAIWAYLGGYGLVLVLAAFGAWYGLRERRGALVLVVWSVVGFLLPYAPVAQQRKLVMGLHIPLAILAVIAAAAVIRRFGKVSMTVAAVGLIAILIPSNLLFMSQDIKLLREGTTAPLYPAYLSDSDLAAMNWLRANTKPTDTVLATRELAVFVPAVSGNQVYFGHWSETPGFSEHLREWMTFLDSATPESYRARFLRDTGVRYVVYPSHPEGQTIALGNGQSIRVFDLGTASYVKKVFESGGTAVYEVRREL